MSTYLCATCWRFFPDDTGPGIDAHNAPHCRDCCTLRDIASRGYSHDSRSIHAVDPHGGHWHGRGSPGMAIMMHPTKS